MKYTDHCYAVTGLAAESPWLVNAGFICGTEKTLIVDTGSTYLSAKTIYGYAESVSPSNQLLVINTEPHFDHIGGNCFFRDRGIDIFGHPELKRDEVDLQRNIREFNDTIANAVRSAAHEAKCFYTQTTLANPNRSITNGDSIELGAVEVIVHETPGHTPVNLSLFVPSDKLLFTGDCIVTEYIPNLEGGSKDAWLSWLNSLQLIEELKPQIIVPGHGDVLVGDAAIKRTVETVRTYLLAAIKDGIPPTAQVK